MLVIIPPLTFLLIFFLLLKRERCWRKTYLSAAIIWGVVLTTITEMVSFFSRISFAWILGAWLIACSLAGIYFYLNHDNFWPSINVKKPLNKLFKTVDESPFLIFSLLSVFILLALTGFVAIYAPPNNYDSMTYHMPRVMNWIQNRSVAHYPTHNLRQIDLSPWSSFAIMNLQILSGSDRFANLIQWFSMAGCLVGVSLISKQLGANLIGQILASVVCATIPMGILQSVTTQNDYVVSFWLVCTVYNTLVITQGQVTSKTCLYFGASLGLSILTKATSYVYALPFLVFWVIHVFKFFGLNFFRPFLFGILPITVLNLGHWWRNFWLFGDPLGVSGNIAKNKLLTIEAVISNLTRNIALHIPTAYQPMNNLFEKYIYLFHEHVLKLDANDIRTTFAGTIFQLPVASNGRPVYLNEDISGNPLTLSLVFAVIIFYLLIPRLRNSLSNSYILLLLSTAILFSTFFAWQPWGTRLHLPFFVLISPFIGDVLGRILHFSKLNYITVFILTCGVLPYIFFNSFRPVLTSYSIFDQTRIETYFNARPDLKGQYAKSMDLTIDKKCYDVGLYSGGDSWEYPLWVLSNEIELPRRMRFKAVNVDNASKAVNPGGDQSFIPCALFVIDRSDVESVINLSNQDENASVSYVKALTNSSILVYLREHLKSDLL